MSVIDEYLAKLDAPQREALERVRRAFQKVAPEAEEVWSYGMPGFKYKGKYLGGFNVFKDHLSFFPTGAPVAVYKDKLKDFKTATGTVQFTVAQQLPQEVLEGMIAIRRAAIDK